MPSNNLARALAIVGDRWTLQIVHALLDGPKRFGEVADALPSIAPNILTGRLRQLVAEGLVGATPYSNRPLRLAYALTSSGRELEGSLALLETWGAHLGGGGNEADGVIHPPCGTPLEARLYCTTCERVVDDLHAVQVHWA
jgi:DNA-binding HxlR family transcriptional regulator